MSELVKAEDLTPDHWILFESAWWKVRKVGETDIVPDHVILSIFIPKEHFPNRVVDGFYLYAKMMPPKSFEFETRKDLL